MMSFSQKFGNLRINGDGVVEVKDIPKKCTKPSARTTTETKVDHKHRRRRKKKTTLHSNKNLHGKQKLTEAAKRRRRKRRERRVSMLRESIKVSVSYIERTEAIQLVIPTRTKTERSFKALWDLAGGHEGIMCLIDMSKSIRFASEIDTYLYRRLRARERYIYVIDDPDESAPKGRLTTCSSPANNAMEFHLTQEFESFIQKYGKCTLEVNRRAKVHIYLNTRMCVSQLLLFQWVRRHAVDEYIMGEVSLDARIMSRKRSLTMVSADDIIATGSLYIPVPSLCKSSLMSELVSIAKNKTKRVRT